MTVPMEGNRPDEWRIEQGLAANKLPILDMTGDTIVEIPPVLWDDLDFQREDEVKAVDDAAELFPREREGWRGFVEWESHPARKARASEILKSQAFPPNAEFQMGALPDTNPVLTGPHWKMWHHAIGGDLTEEPELSWETVLKEKHPDMLHLLQFPYNGEAPKRLVTAIDVMPSSLHFVRNHGGIPNIDADKWSVDIDGLVNTPRNFTLADLQDESRFPRISKLATIQCSGTRRIEQIMLYPGQGDEITQAPWAEGAIGTAKWTGISLKKVIKACGGLKAGAKHLELFGCDTYFKANAPGNYVVSVPWSKVKTNEVILAWEMNDEPLPRIHGYPVRLVVLGYIGARSVKWLYRIKAISDPSLAPVQSKEYLYFNQQIGKYNQHPTDGIQIQEMPVSSAIMSPWSKQSIIHNGHITCKGWAYSGGGRWPERVELSADGGFSWYAVPNEQLSRKHKWTWRTWEYDLPCDVEGWIEIVCRCWDNSLNTQPLTVRAAWNWGLHVTSSAHRVSVYSINKSRHVTRTRLERFKEEGIPLAPLTFPEEFVVQSDEEYKAFWQRNDPRDVDE